MLKNIQLFNDPNILPARRADPLILLKNLMNQ